MKPLKFTCLLRLQQSQIDENAWKDELIEQIHAQILEYMAHESSALAFPELALFAVLNLRDYLKECSNSKYHRELKQLLDKINENCQFIEKKRKTINFTLKDVAQINAWETTVRNKGTPLDTMFKAWSKKNESKKRREASDVDTLNEYSLPPMPKPKPKVTKRQRDSGSDTDENEGPTELFPSSESDSELEVEKPLKKTAQKKKMVKKSVPKKAKKEKATSTSAAVDDDAVENSIVDIVNDLNIADWD
jgi:nucleolar complex protein 2